MTRSELISQIQTKESLLCVGLDTDLEKIPSFLHSFEDPIFEFNKRIIDATADLAVAYKPNLAFYEALGARGWESLQKTIEYCPQDVFLIADAKRGDIGNTSTQYAKAFFQQMNFDAITVAPYMGADSVTPFLQFEDKWVVLLGLTSNESSADFETLKINDSQERLFERVLTKSQEWGGPDQMMYVVGATKADQLQEIREIVPDHFLLIPGVGAQGGDLESVCRNGLNKDFGLLINLSRGIIYASDDKNFDQISRNTAQQIQIDMKRYIDMYL